MPATKPNLTKRCRPQKRSILKSALLLGAALQFNPAFAQNPILQFNSTRNSSLDYVSSSNSYLMGNMSSPSSIGGMNNLPFSIPLQRIHLELMPDNFSNLSSTWSQIYCTLTEVTDYSNGSCPSLSTYFYSYDARKTSDGGYIVCGRADKTGEYSSCPGQTYTDAFLLKTDSRGNPVWYKRYRPQVGGYFWFYTVIEDAATGNFIVGGQSPSADAFVMGTSSTGTVLWNHNIKADHATPQTFKLPSSFSKVASYKAQNNQQYYVLTGPAIVQYYGTNYNAYYGGGMLTTVTAGGVLAQNVQLTQDMYSNFMKTAAVTDAHDGDVVLTGSSGGTYCGQHDDWDMMLMKLNPLTLSSKFMKVYQSGSNGGCTSGSCSVGAAGTGESLVVGRRGGDIYVAGSEISYNMATGATYMVTDNNGNLQRFVPHSSSNAIFGRGMVYNGAGNYPVYSGTQSSTTAMLTKDNYGYFSCEIETSPDPSDLEYSHIPNHDSILNILTIPDVMVSYALPTSITNVCGAATRGASTGARMMPVAREIGIAPNPAIDIVELTLGKDMEAGTIRIYDVHGRNVKSLEFAAATQSLRISTAELVPGMYQMQILSAGQTMIKSFVKQ